MLKCLGLKRFFFSNDTKIGKNVTIEPYVVIGKNVKIGNNVIIKSFSHLESCKIENKVEIGPYARIRPDTILKEGSRSEEHTSELQSRSDLVCRLLLEKKKKHYIHKNHTKQL